MSKPAVQVKDLSVQFNGRVVLNKINFQITDGEIVAVIGPNGSGKTTLFKAILDLVKYSGNVKIWSKAVSEVLPWVGYVPQSFDFDKTIPITVAEFLNFFVRKNPTSLDKIVELLELDKIISQLIGKLSGGQLQRTLIASSLIKNPKLLLLDEPASGIDIEGAKDFYELVQDLNQQGVTIMIISHEINIVQGFADKVLCLNKDLICAGAPKEAITDKVLHQLYGEDVNFHKH